MRAGETTRPKSSRWGRYFSTAGPSSIGPVRSWGRQGPWRFAGAAGFLHGPAQVADHSGPLGAIVGAVDAHAIHSLKDQIADEVVVGRASEGIVAIIGHCAPAAAGRAGFQCSSRVASRLLRSLVRYREGQGAPLLENELSKHSQHRIQAADDVRLVAAKRRKPKDASSVCSWRISWRRSAR